MSATGGANVTINWAQPGPNGRPIASALIRIDNAGPWVSVSASGSYAFPADYSTSHTIDARAVDKEGHLGDIASLSKTSDAKPPPHVFLSKWGNANGQPNCVGTPCQFIQVNWENMPNGSYLLQFQDTRSGSWGAFGAGDRSITMSGSGSNQTQAYYGYQGQPIRILFNGAPSDVLTW